MMQSQQQHLPRSSRRNQNMLYVLQSDLLEVWTKLQVEDYYQNIILAHLDTLPLTQAEERISREIKETYEGKSSYFKLAERSKFRKQALSTLETMINNNSDKPNVDSSELASICEEISSLRDNNLGFAQTLMHLLKKLALQDGAVSDQCMQMINNLDSDNRFLKESFLKDFILFHQGYDPFFSYHYDMRGKMQPKKYSPIIDQLFTLSLSYACRLFKAKNQLLDVMSHSKDATATQDRKEQAKQSFDKKDSNHLQTEGGQTTKGQKRKTSFNFRRKNLSLRHGKQKQGDNGETLEMKSLNVTRKSSSVHKQLKPLEEKGHQKLPLFESLKLKRQKGFDDSDYRKDLKFQTEAEDDGDNRSQSNRYRIKQVKLPKPSVNQSKRTIYSEEDEEISPQKKLCLRQKKTLHPLNKYKNLRTLQQESEKQSVKTEMMKQSSDERESECQSSVYSVPSKMQQSKSLQQSVQKAEIQKTSNSTKDRRVLVDQRSTIKMKPGKWTFLELMKYLKGINFRQEVKSVISDCNWQEDIRVNQSYVCEYSLNDQVALVVIVILLPDGNYQIRLWGPTETCSENLSLSLLSKYLVYFEKMSVASEIQFKGEGFKGLTENDFVLKEQQLFVRKRSSNMIEKKHEFQQFLSLKCSNIVVPQSHSKSIFISEEIQSFSEENSFSFLPFTLINKKVLNENLQMLVKVSENISDMATLNKLLEDEDLDTYQVNRNLKVSNIRALRLHLVNTFSVPFVAAEGCFKFPGFLIYNSYDSYVCQINCSRFNTKLFFGKGFPSIDYFIQHRKVKKGKKYETVDFSVKMFTKQLYGQIESQQNHEGCYGYWQINLSWEDELQGRTRHDMTNCIHFGPESFYVGIEIQSQLIYCFQVGQEDFLI